MKKLVLFTLLLVAVMPLMAQQRSDAEMEAIARQQFMSGKAKGMKALSPTSLKRVHSDQAYAVYSPSNAEGFVVVSRDDRMQPVLGYANGSFDMATVPCNMKWWLGEVEKTYERLQKKGPNDGTPNGDGGDAGLIDLPFITKWGQDAPYDLQVPVAGAPTGCIAVVMAQLMNYHQWPLSARFRGYYEYDEISGDVTSEPSYERKIVEQDVDSRYVWPMKFACGIYVDENGDVKSETYTDEELEQIARLMRDCGLAVGMYYSPGWSDGVNEYLGWSGADPMMCAYAFPAVFSYSDKSVRFHNRAFFSHHEWLSTITHELEQGYPIIYGGTADDEILYDHEFIVHGIDAQGMLKINWGWKGNYDGYYHVDDLTIWDDNHSKILEDFTHNHHIITGIRKEAWAGETYRSEFCMDLLDASEVKYNRNEVPYFSTTLKNFTNYQPMGFDGRLYLAVEEEGQPTQYVDVFQQDLTFGPAMLSYWAEQEFPNNLELEDNHTYRVYIVSRDKREDEYTPVRSVGGPFYFTITVDAQGKGTVEGPVIFEGRFPTDGVKGLKADKSDVNDGVTRVYDLQGRTLYSAPAAAFNLKDVPGRGVVIVRNGDKTKKIIR